jgi:hypothetical protein
MCRQAKIQLFSYNLHLFEKKNEVQNKISLVSSLPSAIHGFAAVSFVFLILSARAAMVARVLFDKKRAVGVP